ncbi:glycosyltransferase [Jiangella alkaliphila]|uniref:Glycosyltransferase involved in cell wall bisynthesis n=1 Tax=Jiangella alkaliphila TaxID=419479 RepID=A0A1H2G6K5_9ACTN|nr:glycosyltransferase [Jiangella alkaliphila]SDU15242.1 Glycosyltransferase involved in cell wall bisynthesis [Jiangella alkaliphila]
MSRPTRRLVIVVRADPVICGHSGEARNLAEVALTRGFDDVRIVTWPIPALQAAGLPLKPLDSILPYSPGITVERPEPVGDYRVPDGRYLLGLTSRLYELFTDGVPTVCISMYLSPHTNAVVEALHGARAGGAGFGVTTIAKAVGSDITNIVRTTLAEGRAGAAAFLLTTFLANDACVAVSEYTRDLIVESALQVDAVCGTRFAAECAARVSVSYPPIDTAAYVDLDPAAVDAALARRGLRRDGYVLFLSRVTLAKGVDDLVAAYQASAGREHVRLVIAGTGPELAQLRALAAGDDRIDFLTDVSDEEKPLLMTGSAAFVLPSKPRPEFVETFGIALVEAMLAGGGPVITTTTGGIPESVGGTAIEVAAGDPAGLAAAIDRAVLELTPEDRQAAALRARAYAMRFDRVQVFDGLIDGLAVPAG